MSEDDDNKLPAPPNAPVRGVFDSGGPIAATPPLATNSKPQSPRPPLAPRRVDINVLDTAEVITGLTARTAELAGRAYPAAQRRGDCYVVVTDFGDQPGRSITLAVAGSHAGAWQGRNESGDILDFAAIALFAGDRKAAFAWARAWLGRDPTQHVEDADRIFAEIEARRRDRRQGNPRNDVERQEFRDRARRLWDEATADLAGTFAAMYLHEAGVSGYDPAAPLRAAQIPALRFHPSCLHPERRRLEPALLAALTDGYGQFQALLRIWLRVARWGATPYAEVTGATARPGALTMGDIAGAAVRFGSPIAQTWDLAIDLEHGLRLHLAHPDHHVLVCVRAQNLINQFIPIGLTRLRICVPLVGSYTGDGRHILRAQRRWIGKIGGIVEFAPLNASLQWPPKVCWKEQTHEPEEIGQAS